jgi:fido (protein-threonine AMPylation protein)
MDLNIGVPWWQITTQVMELTRDLPCWGEHGMSLLEQAVRLHYRAVWIHPFENGNGRWARLLANIWLKLHKTPIVIWPEDDLSGETSSIRNEYIKALHEADRGDFDPLLELHRRHLSE